MSWDDDRLAEEFGRVCAKIDRLDVLLRGNGKGPGVLVRIERLEQVGCFRARWFWLLSSTVVLAVVGAIWKVFWGVAIGHDS